jgi:hypothetical protein
MASEIQELDPRTQTMTDTIKFRHPGQPRGENVFLDLPKVDSSKIALHYRTAITACEILAHNAFGRGYLTFDAEGSQRVEAHDNTLLTREEYYFRVENLDTYSITRTFRD